MVGRPIAAAMRQEGLMVGRPIAPATTQSLQVVRRPIAAAMRQEGCKRMVEPDRSMKERQMKRVLSLIVIGMIGVWEAGCARISTKVVEQPRVDQELQGNRGYLQGIPPPAPSRRGTRQMLQTDVEMATRQEMIPWKKSPQKSLAAQPSAPPVVPEIEMESPKPVDWDEEISLPEPRSVPSRVEEKVSSTVYTVKKGDNLEKIASKVYGDSNQWRRIFKANQDKLKSPSRIYPGQKLIIPAWEKETSRSTSSDSLK